MILNDTRDDESYPKSLLKINGHDLKNVKTFCYLGSRIKNDEPTTGDFEIEARTNSTKGIGIPVVEFFFVLAKIVCLKHRLGEYQ